ncbi:hypothetical protein ACJX0J_030828, partial [Zea mays]
RHAIVAEKLKYVTSVALTSDIWSGNAEEDYLIHAIVNEYELTEKIAAYKSFCVAMRSTFSHIGISLKGSMILLADLSDLFNKHDDKFGSVRATMLGICSSMALGAGAVTSINAVSHLSLRRYMYAIRVRFYMLE